MTRTHPALRAGDRFVRADGVEGKLDVFEVSELAVPDGLVVVVDPSHAPWMFDQLEEVQLSATRKLRVLLSVLRFPSTDTDRARDVVVAATAVAGHEVPHRWDLVTDDSPHPIRVQVDSGMACFTSPPNLKVLTSIQEDEALDSRLTEEALDSRFFLYPDAEGPKQVVAFVSGPGDGVFNCHVGYSEAGDATAIMCDFSMLNEFRVPG